MRGLVIAVVVAIAACSAPAPQAPAARGGAIDAWVIGPSGPVADAEVRVVSLTPASCPCKPIAADDETVGGNEMPECRCPEALAQWRARLDACTWPAPAVHGLRSDARGRVAVPNTATGKVLEASTPSGLRWMTLPARAPDRLAIELMEPITLTLDVGTRVDIRAALLFDDGHCMPFRRAAATKWATVAPVVRSEEQWPTLIVEAPGFATIVRSWFESAPALELPLHRAQVAAGTCEGDLVRLDNPFQHIVAKVDRSEKFSLAGALDLWNDVTCEKQGDVVSEWTFTHDEGLSEGGSISGGLFGGSGSCHDVEVVDRAGRPIDRAEVMFNAHPGQNGYGGTISMTGAQGRACVEDVRPGGDLDVHPPDDLGGWCAGDANLRVQQHHMAKPIRIVLAIRKLPRSKFRGRLLSPEKVPIAGAYVSTSEVAPTTGCSVGGTATESGPDGSFELDLLHGTMKLDIQHDWYAEKHVELKVPSREREIILDRGITWTARVLDPDGKNIDRCSIFLTLDGGRIMTTKCSAKGFTFTTLVPGKAKLSVRVENHPLGTFRSLARVIQIGHGSKLGDIKWPAGETISGRVVDPNGQPIAGARLTALPPGAVDLSDRFADGEVMLEAGADGRFTLRHLQPGAWTITGDRRASKHTTMTIKAGTTNLQFVTPR
ncbi:MAG TPA: carboxypeptidase-like regulatory domain-containing protein [Kofleriaceae bacterium]